MENQSVADGGLQYLPQITVQYIYLDFDGELTSYNGEILSLEEVEVQDPCLTEERIKNILAELNAKYAHRNIVFVTAPPETAEYSTIFIGKTSAFDPYGNFAGVAETVDENNAVKNDNAFVNLDSTSSDAEIIAVISHETEHLTGILNHDGTGLEAYAAHRIIGPGTTSTGITISSGNSVTISSGGVANSMTVTSSGVAYVLSGGVANNTLVSGRFFMVLENATMFVSSGGSVSNTVLRENGWLYLSGGKAVKTTVDPQCWMQVYRGASATSVTVNGGGTLIVDSAFISEVDAAAKARVVLCSGAQVRGRNYFGGTITLSATVDFSSAEVCYSLEDRLSTDSFIINDLSLITGAPSYSVIVSATQTVGTYMLAAGASAFNGSITVRNTGGTSYGTLSVGNALVYNNFKYTLTQSSGILSFGVSQYVSSTASNVKVYSSGFLTSQNSSINGAVLVSGGNNSMFVSSGGIANSTTISSGGFMAVSSGGTANSTTVSYFGSVHISGGGVANKTVVNNFGRVYISSGAVVNSTTVNSGGEIAIFSGGVANRTTVQGLGAHLSILTSGMSPIFLPPIHGVISISSGGIANSTTVNSGGCTYIYSGGVANSITVNSAGTMQISNGGVATGTVVNSQGKLSILSGGIHRGTLQIVSGGTVSAYQGSVIDFSVSGRTTGDTYLINDLSQITGAPSYTITVSADQSFGTYKLAAGASAFNGSITVRNTGGTSYGTLSVGNVLVCNDVKYALTLESGNLSLVVSQNEQYDLSATFTHAEYGDPLNISIVTGTYSDSARITADDNVYVDWFIANMGDSITVPFKTALYLDNALLAEWTHASGLESNYLDGLDDYDLGKLSVGSHTLTLVTDYGNAIAETDENNNTYTKSFYVSSAADNVKVYSYGTLTSQNSSINGAVLAGGGNNSMFVSSGGAVNSTTVSSGGVMVLYAGGSADNTFVNNSGGVLLSGGTLTNTYMTGNGSVTILNGGLAEGTFMSGNGVMDVYNGGAANRTSVACGNVTVHNGGFVNSTVVTVDPNGTLCGTMTILNGGVANCTTVNSLGELFISSGGIHRGALQIVSGGTVSAYQGSVIDFTIYDRTEADGYLINNFNRIKGAPTYTVTVSGSQASGTYKLASGAILFKGTIVVFDTYGTERGTLSVGSTLSYGSCSYTLTRSGSTFSLVVTNSAQYDLSATYSHGEYGGPLNISVVEGTYSDSTSITVDDHVYVDWFVANMGDSITGPFKTALYLDDTLLGEWTHARGLGSNYLDGLEDLDLGKLSAGSHTLKLVTDHGNVIAETDESNNTYTKTFYVSQTATQVKVYSSGTLTSQSSTISGAELAAGANNSMFVSAGGTAANTRILGNGNVYVSSGGMVINTHVGFTAHQISGNTVVSSGCLRVHAGGQALNTTVSAAVAGNGGVFHIEKGGAAGNTLICGGRMYISSGAFHAGSLQVVSGGTVSAYQGALIDFTLVGRTTASAYLINDLSLIKGAPSYSITVFADQASGTYKLAQGASGFTGTLSIGSSDAEYGSVAVNGDDVVYRNKSYSLDLVGGDLTLTISAVASQTDSNDLDGNGLADTILRHTRQGYCGAWLTKGDSSVIGWGDLSTIGSDVDLLGMGNVKDSSESGLDIFMLNGNSVAAWITENGKVSGYRTLYKVNANMEVLGIADFDRDGVTDYLLRSTTGDVGCIMGDGNRWNYFQSLGKEWRILGTGDFNGDGADDLILKHDAGFAGTWLTQEDGSVKWRNLDTLKGGLEIIGSGDFNGDGTDDILLRKGNWIGAWLVENGSVDGFMGIDTNSHSIEQIGDFDGDGIDDLRIRSAAGDIGVLYVKGADTTQWQYFQSVGSEWSTAFDAKVF